MPSLPLARSLTVRVDRPTLLPALVVIAVFLPEAFGVVLFGFRLTPARFVLLALCPLMMFSFVGLLASERYRLVLADLLMPATLIWMIVALSQSDGMDRALKSGGVSGLELAGSYLVMRCLLRNVTDIHASVRLFCICAAIAGVLGLADTLANFHILHDYLALLTGYTYFNPLPAEDLARLGMFRSESLFDHPILFGVVMCYALILSVDLQGRTRLLCRLGTGLGLFLSLSSAPWMGLFVGIILWSYLRFASFSHRWGILISIGALSGAAFFILVPEPFGWIFSHFILDQKTGWFRLLIWQYAGYDVLNSPLIGIGISQDWFRPGWMPASVDSLWLGLAMAYGIPGSVLVGLALLGASSLPVVMKPATVGTIGPMEVRLSDALGILCFLTIFLGFTVDYWGAAFTIIGLLAGIRAALGQLAAGRAER